MRCAYDAGVFQAIYEKFERKDENKPLFDIVAGTSCGALNAVYTSKPCCRKS